MTEPERFLKAERHLQDALSYRTPRPSAFRNGLPVLYSWVYQIQTANWWSLFLFILSWVFMYLVILEDT